MIRSLPRGLLVLAILLLVALAAWLIFREAPTEQASQRPTPRTEQAGATPAVRHSWGGALNSARADGASFFDLHASRRFAAEVRPEVRKYVVELNSRALLPLPESTLDEVFPEAALRDAGPAVAFVQFNDHPTDAQRAIVAAQGVELLTYVTGYAWSARAQVTAFEAVRKLPFVRALARLDARDKLAPQVFLGQIPPHATTDDGRARFLLLGTPEASADSVAAETKKHPALAAADVRPAVPSVLGPRFEVTLQAAAVAELAGLPSAAYVEYVLPPVASRDSTTDLQSNIGAVRDFPPNLDGSGIKAAVREIGIPSAHVDFNSRLTRVDGTGSSSPVEISHSTGVVGQVGSAGVAVAQAKGVAPNVALYLYSLVDGAFLVNDILDAAGRGARISNHSYGPTVSSWGDYQTTSADWDNALRGNNLIGMFAGNEEAGQTYKHIDFFVGAKNTVCVGSSDAAARAGPPKVDGIAFFSQFGPMNDGRVKPDVVAFGDGVTLCAGTNGSTTISGTSFSTPATTGVMALIFQQYKSRAGSEPSAALAKAILCNSAADLGATGPDGVYGFGLVDAQAAVSTINLSQSAGVSPFFEGVLNNGDSQSFTVNLQSSGEFKLTLCWHDVAGNPVALKALVNDLDLQVTAPDSTKFYPFSLDPANPANPATATGANTVDPIEQVIVANPALGTWTVTVKGTGIVSGPQSFAVCINKPKEPLSLMPVILASPNQGNTPLVVAFSANASTGEIVSYAWDFGDGSTGSGAEVTHTYASPGTFTVTLTVTDNKGKTASTTTIISVTKRVVEVFPSRATARLDFASPSRDKLQLVLTVPDLVLTSQQWRDQQKVWREEVAAGTFSGDTYAVSVGNSKLATFTTDAKGAFKSKTASFKLNPPQGTITIQFNGNAALDDIFKAGGMTNDPASSGLHELPVTVETPEAIYNATFKLLYKNTRGKTGTAKTL